MANGEGRDCCCQPEAVSEANVAEASNCPEALQMCPTCWPVSLPDFQKRIAVIWPDTLLLNSVPSSCGPTWTFGRTGVWVVNSVCGVLVACADPQKKQATTSIDNTKHTNPLLLILIIASSELETAPGPEREPETGRVGAAKIDALCSLSFLRRLAEKFFSSYW